MSKVDLCIFCDAVPCECNKPKQATKKASKRAQSPVVTEAAPAVPVSGVPVKSVTDMRAAMRRSAAEAPKVTKVKPPVVPVKPEYIQPETPIDDLLFADAVRNLSSMLHPNELEKYKVLITSQPSPKDRARIWRHRNNG